MSILQKLVARFPWWSECRVAMKGNALPHSRTNLGRTFVSGCVLLAFLWTLALSVSPRLHERIHPAANRLQHNCAVTFVASGGYEHSFHAPLVSGPAPTIQFSKIPALTPQWVQSLFLGASVFEHAPPQNS
ncbi:MAG: hypothetical protein M3R29_04200 [Verrucomicrobiota bacterium]|nr:hypothetical protein [Verrucomicrobiota bacterium]